MLVFCKIFNATGAIEKAYLALNEGNIVKAFLFSKNAVLSSEAAFLDPSMLALLYFPEDQK